MAPHRERAPRHGGARAGPGKPVLDAATGAPPGGGGIHRNGGMGTSYPIIELGKMLLGRKPDKSFRFDPMGPRVLAASSGLAPWSMAANWNLWFREFGPAQFPTGNKSSGYHPAGTGTPPPERTACLWRQFGGKGGWGEVALAVLTLACCPPSGAEGGFPCNFRSIKPGLNFRIAVERCASRKKL